MAVKAFSLIELLVVMAIIGILAAVAIPSYKDYSIKTKIASVYPLVDNIKGLSFVYSQKNGNFPTAVQLGWSTNTTYPWAVNNPSQYNKYISEMDINQNNSCSNKMMQVAFRFNNTALGYSGNTLAIDWWITANDNTGVTTTRCFYRTTYGTSAAEAQAYFPTQCQTALDGSSGPPCI